MISSQELDPPIAVMAIDFVSRLRRASEQLDGLSAANPDNGSPENMVARFDTAASFTVGRDLSTGALNSAAAAALGLVPGAHLSALPLEPEDQKALAEHISRLLNSIRDTPMPPQCQGSCPLFYFSPIFRRAG